MLNKRPLIATALLVLASAAPALAGPNHYPGTTGSMPMSAPAPDTSTLAPNPDAQDPQTFQPRGLSADEIPPTASTPSENGWETFHDATPNPSVDACENAKGRHQDYDCIGGN